MKRKPLLMTTLGHPGSGKTYFTERLTKECNFFFINSDKVRMEMFPKPTYKPEEHRALFNFLDWLLQELLRKGISVVLDANSNRRAYRARYAKLAKKSDATYILLHIKTPEEVAMKRLVSRGKLKSTEKKKFYRPITPPVFYLLKGEIELPTKKEPSLEIDGLLPYKQQAKVFKDWYEHHT